MTGPVTNPVRVCRRNRFEKLPPDTKLVTRPSRWGNDHHVDPGNKTPAEHARVVELLRLDLIADPGRCAETRTHLAGWNLACACRLDWPCHADLLLRIARGEDPADYRTH